MGVHELVDVLEGVLVGVLDVDGVPVGERDLLCVPVCVGDNPFDGVDVIVRVGLPVGLEERVDVLRT